VIPRLGSQLVSTWLVITAVASIVAIVDGGWLASWTALAPAEIWRGQIWRLVTWVFVEPSPWSLVFTLAVIYKFGGELAPRWGDRRLLRFMMQVVIAASLATALLALVSDLTWLVQRCGGLAMTNALIIAWARQYPGYTIRMFGFFDLGGPRLVGATVGVTILIALGSSPFWYAPELVATLVAALYPRGWLAR
jgi:membrane associated rhomboid family serine protease